MKMKKEALAIKTEAREILPAGLSTKSINFSVPFFSFNTTEMTFDFSRSLFWL